MTGTGESSYRQYLASDPMTLEMLVCTYSDALVRYAYCYVGSVAAAEDVMEDAFAACYVRKLKFDSLEQAKSWLYKTVRSRAVDYLRRHRHLVPLEDATQALFSQGPLEDLITKQRNMIIFRCMQRLPQQYRAVLQLHYFDGFEIPDICRILGKGKKQVYNLLSRARIALKELLVKEGITSEDL